MPFDLRKKLKSKILIFTILFSSLIFVAVGVPTILAVTLSNDTTAQNSTTDENSKKIHDCTTIQDGILNYSSGHYLEEEPLKVGFDIFGYNYQAHQFKGSYANAYLGGYGFPPYEGDDEAYFQRLVDELFYGDISEAEAGMEGVWCWPYRDVKLLMKWNDAWLSNKDCDGDGTLDRYYGYDSYIGSGAWLTNHQWGTDIDGDGKKYNWNYFVKIVAVPADAESVDDFWYTAEGVEIGPVIWGSFAIIQEVVNDPSTGEHGVSYLSPASPGLGHYK
ncbi:MAG: hypothetical protein ACFFE4_22435 [Candidatus Thorarchaeota archaeon]